MSDNMHPFDDQGPDADPEGNEEIWSLELGDDASESEHTDLGDGREIGADHEDHDFDDALADHDVLGDDLATELDPADRAIDVGDQSGDAVDTDRLEADPDEARVAEADPTETDQFDPVELAVDAETGAPFDDAQVAGLLTDLDVDIGEFDRTMIELGLHVEPDSRSVVVTLEQLEVESRVEHADVDRLEQLLAGGAEVRMSNGDMLVGLDDRTDEAIVERDGGTRRISLDQIESRWSNHAFEMVVTETAAGRVVLLPVAAGPAPLNGGVSG